LVDILKNPADNSVAFFTEAGQTVGFGHLMRCVALAEACMEAGMDVLMFISADGNLDDSLLSQICQCPYTIGDWLNTDIRGLREDVFHFAVFDTYKINDDILSRYRQPGLRQILFHDYHGDEMLPQVPAAIINGAIHVTAPECRAISGKYDFFYGPSFQVLRKPFWDCHSKIIRETIEDVLVTVGGSDPGDMMRPILADLVNRFESVEIHAVIGPGFSGFNNLEELFPEVNFEVEPSAQRMLWLMNRCDIAVSSAGQTLAELARVGVPTYGFMVADNQQYNYKGWIEAGFLCEYHISETNIFDLSFEERKLRSKIGMLTIDGQGARRIVARIKQYDQ
jgi:UDP-2,4-diacetamido-2,4,6-trideoxy-beta-L-altropyranose hydrolase